MHKLLLPLALTLALAVPAAADAAVMTMDGDTLVFRADPGEDNLPALYPGTHAGINVDDLNGHPIRLEGANCTPYNGGLDCGTPARLRLELGDGADRVDWATTFPSSVDVEVQGGPGNDVLKANEYGRNEVVLDGGDGNDVLDGFAQADVLRGGAGDDSLNGMSGDDVLEGGDGDDNLRPDTSARTMGRDVIDGGHGFDSVNDWTNPAGEVHPAVTVSADGVANDGRPGEGDNLLNVEGIMSGVSGTFVMSDGADEVLVYSYLDEQPSSVDGRGGDDWLEGGNAVETIDGGAGADRIEGGFNNDVLTGGPGADAIFGDETDAQCGGYGQSCTVPFGNDTIHARDGEVDNVDCGIGTDRAVVDTIDVVANCEDVDAAAPPAPAAPAGGDAAHPGPRAGAALAVKRTRLAAALRRGVRINVTGAAPGRSKATLSRGRRVVAVGGLVVAADGRGRATLRFTRAAARSLAHAKTVRLTLRAGGATSAVTLKR